MRAPCLTYVGREGTFNQDMTCSDTFTVMITTNGDETMYTETDPCTYTLNNETITLSYLSGSIAIGSIMGNTFTIADDDGVVFISRK